MKYIQTKKSHASDPVMFFKQRLRLCYIS